MSVLAHELRPGAYHDSIVLLSLQAGLAAMPGVLDCGVAMATETNLSLLAANGLVPDPAPSAGPEDLLVVVKAVDRESAVRALGRVDELLTSRREAEPGEYRPKSLAAAANHLPRARWVLVSVAGRFAAGVARDALDLGKNVFLYSDNVSVSEETDLKRRARERGLLVLGPDCGTAIVAGAGFGFANRVRRGNVGVVAASGTGLQTVACRVHAAGAGISHALGTGGRDLSAAVGGETAFAALGLLARDPGTRAIVLVSKPPAPEVARRLLLAARGAKKPVVVDFLGHPAPAVRLGPLHFARDLEEAAELAVSLGGDLPASEPGPVDRPHLRGVFSGGTLAQEAIQGLRSFLQPLHSNIAAEGIVPLDDPCRSRGHTIVDLGADELMVGRLHPMIDPDLCRRRLRQEAADSSVGVILLDVVLGDGAHPDPARELAPAIAEVRGAQVVAVVVGTEEDPQGLGEQVRRLEEAGAKVCRSLRAAVEHTIARLARAEPFPAISPGALEEPVAAINVGVEIFHDSLRAQGLECVHVEWRPPAGGNDRLRAILEKMKR